MKITQLKINGIENPVGYRMDTLTCSWKVEDTACRRAADTRIEVGGDADFSTILFRREGADLHSTGEELDVPLRPRTAYWCRVTVTGEADAGSRSAAGETDAAASAEAVGSTAASTPEAASAVCTFETGKMSEPWEADWVAAAEDEKFHPVFRRIFRLPADKEIVRARLYASAVGLFEPWLNGKKLGDELLTPYITNYEAGIQVITFKAEERLLSGENNWLELYCGKGWYMGTFGLELHCNNYGDRMAAIAELYIDYADGSTDCIKTDSDWEVRGTDVEESGIYYGETVNHLQNREKDNPWHPVEVLHIPEQPDACAAPDGTPAAASASAAGICPSGVANLRKDHLEDRLSLPVRAMEQLPVQNVILTPAGETILDMGQNFAGYLQFRSNFPKGTKITLEMAEILQNGCFYHKNYRDAQSQFVYISDGRKETVRVHCTYFGFRYVKVTGWPGEIRKEDFTGMVMYSALDRAGYIKTGNAKVNRLYENTLWSLKSNFIDMPTDCPQRSERLGWTGDAQVFSPTACYHMQTAAFYHKFIKDLRDEQKMIDGAIPNYVPNIGHKTDAGAVWGDIGTMLPDTLYRFTGNLTELRYDYPMMKDWVDWIDRKDAARGSRHYLFDFGFQFGDWLALDGMTPTSFKGSTDDSFIASVYYCHSAEITAQAAERLADAGHDNADAARNAERLSFADDAARFHALAEKIRAAILQEYFTPNGRLAVDTQTACVIALKFGICPDRGRMLEQFRIRLQKDGYQIKGGFVGAPLLCTVLGEAGMTDTAYDFLFNEKFPGWLYEVNLGATTIWERWNSVLEDGTISDTGMNSLNHYSYGSVVEFLYAFAAGIRPLEPGFVRAVIDPHPDIRLGSLDCSYDSAAGKYRSSWTIEKDGLLTVQVAVPFGAEAEVILPEDPEKRRLTLAAGEYTWQYQPKRDYRKPYGWQTKLSRAADDSGVLEILRQHVPALYGMALSGDIETGSCTFEDLSHMGFLPIDPEELKKAVAELEMRIVC
jgi:alpha-L-rhamnosidase